MARREEAIDVYICTYSMNFNMVSHILCFDGQQERSKPLERAEISAHPEEIYFA